MILLLIRYSLYIYIHDSLSMNMKLDRLHHINLSPSKSILDEIILDD